MTNSNNDSEENQSLDISLKDHPFLSVESNLSVNALYNILIKNPILVNMTDEKKETFLTYALKRNNNPIIDLILTSPLLDLNYQDKKGNTYLHISVIQQNIKVIKKLLDKGISINTKNNDGNTALHFAYYINNLDIIKILKEHKDINLNKRNNQGLIAEEIIPTNELDKIAGYEVCMNFDININDELIFNENEAHEKYDLYANKNENRNIKKNNMDSNESGETQYKTEDKKTKKTTSKNDKQNFQKTTKETTNIKNNKNNIKKDDDKFKEKDNNADIKMNNNNVSKNNSSKKNSISDEYGGLISLPFRSGVALRKISNIDVVHNEYDKFIRKESENYNFYAELLNSNRETTQNLKQKGKNNLSSVLENNNISEMNSNIENNNIFDKKINSSSLLNNSLKNNNISLANLSFKNNNNNNHNSSLLNNSNKNNINIINSSHNNNNNITILENIMINCSNKPLLDFLIQINMHKYYNHLNNNGFKDINTIIENAKKDIYITDIGLKNIGINKTGDRAKILIRIKEKANLFEYTIPKSVYHTNNVLEQIEDDENVYKLYEWLKSIRLEQYINNFLNNGYYSIDLLFMQLLSNNPLTDEILKNELGIDKLGHRTRILNKIIEECPSYLDKLKDTVVTFYKNEKIKKCNECVTC